LGVVQAQPICYDYDNSGNRIVRKNCAPSMTCLCTSTNSFTIGDATESYLTPTILSQTSLYPALNQTGQPNLCVMVAGELIIDVNVSFSGITFMMQPAASISLNNDAVASFYGCTFSTCDEMWTGITVGENSELNMDSCKVNDAFHGIRYTKSTSRGIISGTTFNQNYRGILMDGSQFSYITLEVNFEGNTFKSDAASLKPYLGLYSTAKTLVGVEAHNTQFIFGNLSQTGTNLFTGIHNGFFLLNSFAMLNNLNFNNLVPYSSNSTLGVNPLPSQGYATANKLGVLSLYSALLMDNCTMNGVDRAINAKDNFLLAVYNSNFNADALCIFASAALGNAGNAITLSDNSQLKGKIMAIKLVDTKNTNVEIKNNTNIESTGSSSGIGISISDMLVGSTGTKLIEKNSIKLVTNYEGITLNQGGSYVIYDNAFTIDTGSNTQLTYGINLSNTKNNKLIKNNLATNVSSSLSSSSSDVSSGIYLTSAADNTLCCNSLDKTTYGIHAVGASDNSKLFYNQMNNNATAGLYVETGAKIGVQDDHWNKWTGTYSASRNAAKNVNTSTLLDASKIKVSKPSNPASPWFPAFISPANNWFESKSPTQNSVECSLTGACDPTISGGSDFPTGGDQNAASRYASGHYLGEVYGSYTDWVGKRWVLENIATNPDWLNDAAINTLKTNQDNNGNIKKLIDIEKAAAQFFQPPIPKMKAIESIVNTIKTNQTRIRQIEVLLLTDSTNTALRNERKDLMIEQSQMYQRWSTIVLETERSALAKIVETTNLNESIAPENLFEANEKQINEIYLNTVARGDSLSESQKSLITSIAAQCPMIGGIAVFKARHLYAYFGLPIFNDSEICSFISGGQKVVKQQSNAEVSIFPNPAQDVLYINTIFVTPTRIVLRDITGRIAIEQDFTQHVQLSTAGLQNGTYICEVWRNNQRIKTEKLVIIH
jgi:parallel beta-helix repeat protein